MPAKSAGFQTLATTIQNEKYEKKTADIKAETQTLKKKLLEMEQRKADYESAKREREQTIEAIAQMEHDMQQSL